MAIQNLTPELSEYYKIGDQKGVLVTQVFENDPADKAGIKTKDVITAVGGQEVTTARELSRKIAESPVGKEVGITVFRDGDQMAFKVKLAKRDDSVDLAGRAAPGSGEALGIKVAELTPESAERYGFDENDKGVVVTSVDPEGKGAEAGVQTGDLVKEVNHETIMSVDAFETKMENISSEKSIQLLIMRPRVGFLVINIEN